MMQNDKYLNEAIDRTVRDMMDVDPAAGLGRRVLAKIEEPVSKRVLTFPRLAAMTAFAAAAVVLAIAMLLRTPSRDSRQLATMTQPVTNPPVANAIPNAPRVPQPQPHAPSPVSSQSRRAAANDRRVDAANVASGTNVVIAPLNAMDPIRFAPVGPQTIVVTAIGVDLIQVAPLRMDPLSTTPQ